MARSAGNLHNRSGIYRPSHVVKIKLGLSFALPSSIYVFISQHIDSILFIYDRPMSGPMRCFVTPGYSTHTDGIPN